MEKTVKVWPEWKIEEQLGEGSFGKVYKIRRENQGRVEYAALKVIEIPKSEAELMETRANGLDDNLIQTYYENAAKDLFNEIRIMEPLSSAPNIVTLQDARLEKKEDGIGWTIYIRMELLTSMEDYLRKKKLTVEEVMKLGTDICSAISSCEKAHIIHRDIKPQNIFVNEFGDFKLGDFGIARQLEGIGPMRPMKGRSMYRAPEIEKNLAYDHTVDIYSLGIVLYRYMNHGRAPFYPPYPQSIPVEEIVKAELRREKGEEMPAPDEADEELARIILKACSYIPSERYQSGESMRLDLINHWYQLKTNMKCVYAPPEKFGIGSETKRILYPNNMREEEEQQLFVAVYASPEVLEGRKTSVIAENEDVNTKKRHFAAVIAVLVLIGFILCFFFL